MDGFAEDQIAVSEIEVRIFLGEFEIADTVTFGRVKPGRDNRAPEVCRQASLGRGEGEEAKKQEQGIEARHD